MARSRANPLPDLLVAEHQLEQAGLAGWLEAPVATALPSYARFMVWRTAHDPRGVHEGPTVRDLLRASWNATEIRRYKLHDLAAALGHRAARAVKLRELALPELASPAWPAWLAERGLTWFGEQSSARYLREPGSSPTTVVAALTQRIPVQHYRKAENQRTLLDAVADEVPGHLEAVPPPLAVTQPWAVRVAEKAVAVQAEVRGAISEADSMRIAPERRYIRLDWYEPGCRGAMVEVEITLGPDGAVDSVIACGHPWPCRWTLAGLREAARWLDTEDGSRFAQHGERPAWQRALAELERRKPQPGGVTIDVDPDAGTARVLDADGNARTPPPAWEWRVAAEDRFVTAARAGLGTLLPLVVGDPRVRVRGRPARVVQHQPRLALVPVASGAELRLEIGGWTGDLATLQRAGELVLVPSPAGEVGFADPRAVPADLLPWIGTTFPAAAIPELLASLDRGGVLVDRRPGIAGEVVPWPVKLTADLGFERTTGLAGQVRLELWDDSRARPGTGPESEIVATDGALVEHVRDTAAERAAVDALLADLGVTGTADDAFLAPTLTEAVAVAKALEARADVAVHWRKPLRVTSVRAGQARVSLRSVGAWLEVTGDVEGSTLPLGDLLAAIRDRRELFEIRPGEVIELAAPLFEELGRLADLAETHGKGLRIGRVHQARLQDDLADRLISAPPGFREPETVEIPATLQAELRPYQADGYRWLARRATWGPGAVLAADMGLGKTVQAIALLCARPGPTLVVAPTSVVPNWIAELARFAPHLVVVDHRGDRRNRVPLKPTPGQVVLTSWDLLVRDDEILAPIRWDVAVFDEAHAIKNASTRRAVAAGSLDVGFRLALTGTPIENRLSELWSLLSIVVPGLLPGEAQFRARFQVPIERDHDADRLRRLREIVLPFLLRRTKPEVAAFLPPKTEVIERVELPHPERTRYTQLRRSALAELQGAKGPQARFRVLAALTRLRQLSCDARLVEPKLTSIGPKVARLVELATDLVAGGERTLVFSEFTSLLDLCEPALTAAGLTFLRLDGGTTPKERERRVAAFQAGEGQLFLISRKAGGTGLNLTGATTVIHLDPWWNPAVEDQATDRAHRLGQERPVTVIRLVAADTLEERVIQLQQEKRALVAGVLEGASVARPLDPSELLALLDKEDAPPMIAALSVQQQARRAVDAFERAPMAASTRENYASQIRRFVTWLDGRPPDGDLRSEIAAFLASGPENKMRTSAMAKLRSMAPPGS